MSTVVKYEFSERRGSPRYPWDKWLDGRVHKLTHGVDFEGARSVISGAHKKAHERGLKVRTAQPDNNTVMIQAFKP